MTMVKNIFVITDLPEASILILRGSQIFPYGFSDLICKISIIWPNEILRVLFSGQNHPN